MKKLFNTLWHKGSRLRTSSLLLVLMLSFAGTVQAYDGLTYWNIYKDNGWLNSSGYDFSSSAVALGTTTSFYIKGFWVKGTFDSFWLDQVVFNYTLNGTYLNNYVVNGDWQAPGSSFYVEASGSNICNLLNDSHINNPGNNTLTLKVDAKKNGNISNTMSRNITFTLPGFTSVTTSATITAEPSSNASKTISFTHYGTALTTSNCSITGTDAGKFSVTSISESGVTVRFNAPSTEGTYTASLTITDAHSKSSGTISLTGRSGYPTTVEIASAPVVENGPKVTLSGYLRYTGCDDGLLKRGFFYCEGSSCNVTTSSLKAEIDGETSIKAKETFSKTFSQSSNATALKANTTYCYKAYVYSNSNSQYILSDETGKFTTAKECQIAVNDTVYYTVDNTQPEDPCELRFQTLAAAVADAKKAHKDANNVTIDAWINSSKIVQKPIVIEVEYGKYGNSDNSTRDASLENINTTSISNYVPTPTNPGDKLIVRAKNSAKKPIFQGGLSLLGARNVILKNLQITRSTSTDNHTGSAVEYGFYIENSNTPNTITPGTFANANCEMIACEVDATGFNCVHASGVGGLKFEECIFNLQGTDTGDNAKYWGASVKFMSCKNLQFTRNNMRGSHATTIFLQGSQNVLIMNNVFWNDNLFSDNVAFVRPVTYYDSSDGSTSPNIQDVAIFYNTFYLEDHAASAYNVDFLRFGSSHAKQTGQTSRYVASKIYFKYNNCYSYDDKISSRNNDATAFQSVTLTSGNYAYNNFWSKGDAKPDDIGTQSELKFGTEYKHINVEDQVCKSTATDPDELVFRGSLLNIGAKPASDPSGLEVANKTNADRFSVIRRSEAGGDWTYGAFQQANIVEIDTIIWVGGNSGLWDVRSNWVTKSGRKLNCANFFSTNLHVIIPDAENLKNIPEIPVWNSTAQRGNYPEEYVAAGLRASFDEVSQFTKSITIEAGGAIKGIENLKGDGTLRYTRASNSMEVRRNEWVLVGGVIKPFVSGHSGDARDVVSGDFYITDQKPHVYMQHFTVSGTSTPTFKPGVPFTSLEESVPTNSAFGIMIPDQYGPLKVPASRYYTRYENNPSMVDDGTAPKTFEFEGRFANENAMPQYSATTSWTFVNNSYPANLNVSKLRYDNSDCGLLVKIYDYEDKNWDTAVPSSEAAGSAIYVKPNNGFAIKASSAKTVTTTQGEYGSGSTIYYKRAFDDTYLRLRVQNTSEAAASSLTVRYNGEMIDKVFSHNETTPEVYVKEGDNIYSSYGIDDEAEIIPISLTNKQSNKNLSVMFSLKAIEGFESVILEDRLYGNTYDLTEGETPVFSGIAPGDCLGRFYLILNYADEDEPVIVTDVTDNGASAGGIDIYHASGNEVVVSSAENVALEKVYVTDMSGRTTEIKLSNAHYNVIDLDGLQGVYIIKAVGDSASKTEKVIVK